MTLNADIMLERNGNNVNEIWMTQDDYNLLPKPVERFKKESDLQEQVAHYLRIQYPDVLFHSDFGSGIKLTMGQAAKQKRQNGGRRAWPDMFIARPKIELKSARGFASINSDDGWCGIEANTLSDDDLFYDYDFSAGLFLELKREGTRLKKKNGEWASDHIAEQAEVLEKLRDAGYMAEFAVGFDEAKRIIDGYLGSK